MNKKSLSFLTLTPMIFATACGSGSSGTSSISSLPNASDGVASAASALRLKALAASSDHADQKPEKPPGERPEGKSTSGQGISSAESVTWGSGKSRAACELARMVIHSSAPISIADRYKCMIGLVSDNNIIADPYDGKDHYLTLGSSGGEAASHGVSGSRALKFNVTKDSNGNITSFKMFACRNSNQDHYVNIDNVDGVATYTAVNNMNFGEDNSAGRTTVTGEFADGAWTSSKVLTSDLKRSRDSDHSENQSITISQDASSIILSGYRSGTHDGHSMQNQVYAESQILNSSSVDTLELGEGSARVVFTRAGSTNYDKTTSWDGTMKTLATPSAGTYYADVSSATLPAVGTPDTSFASGETWDCSVPSGETAVAVSESELPEAERAQCMKRDMSDHGGDFECGGGD